MNLLKTSVLSAIETVIKLSAGFLVLKYLSVKTGPEGIATFGQFQNFVAAATTMCSGAFVTGLVRFVSESHHKNESKPHIARAMGLASVLLVLSAIPMLLVPDRISQLIFGSSTFAWAFVCLALAMPFNVFFQIIMAVLNGAGHVKTLIISKSASSILLLGLSLILVTALGLAGGLASLVMAPASAIFVTVVLISRLPDIDWSWFKPQFDRQTLRQFAPFWLMSMTTVISTPVVLISIRTFVGDNLGWVNAGYWEASWRISELYLLVITTGLSVYYVPELSRAEDNFVERHLVLRTIAFAVFTSGTLATAIYLLRDVVIMVMFSGKFAPVEGIIAPQLFGSVVRIGCWVIAYHMIVRGKVWWMICSELFFGLSLYFGSAYLSKRFGLIGLSYAFLLNASAYAVFATGYYLRFIGRGSGRRAIR